MNGVLVVHPKSLLVDDDGTAVGLVVRDYKPKERGRNGEKQKKEKKQSESEAD
jgi:hypothetical protein